MRAETTTPARVLTAEDIGGHKTFDDPDAVVPIQVDPGERIPLPPASVNVLTYEFKA
jgi:hypothetical protein